MKQQQFAYFFPKYYKKAFIIQYKMSAYQVQDDEDYLDGYCSDNDERGIVGRFLGDVDKKNRCSYPYDCIGKLMSVYPKIVNNRQVFLIVQGTAWLISATEILTVAHNIFSKIRKQRSNIETMRFKLFTTSDKMQSFSIRQIKFHPRYEHHLNSTDNYVYDYALLKLAEPIIRQKYLDLHLDFDQQFSHEQLRNLQLKLIGFPRDPKLSSLEQIYTETEFKMTQCSYSESLMTQKTETTEKVTIFHEYGCAEHLLPSEEGHSGSPIFAKIQEKLVVVMIHKGGKDADYQSNSQNSSINHSFIMKEPNSKNFGRIFTSRLPWLNGDILHNLIEWSLQMNKEKRTDIFALSPPYKDLSLETMRNHTLWDPETPHFNKFLLNQKKISKQPQQKIGWHHLISKSKMYLENTILLKDITLPKSSTIFLGFIHNSLKDNQNCSFDIYQDKSLCLMISRQKDKYIGKISLNGQILQKIQDINIEGQIRLRLNYDKNPHISRIKNLQAKMQQKLTNCFQVKQLVKQPAPSLQTKQTIITTISLDKPAYNFDIEQGYHFYVSMSNQNTSLHIDL